MNLGSFLVLFILSTDPAGFYGASVVNLSQTFQLYLLFDNLESKHLFQHSKWRKGSTKIDHVGCPTNKFSAESYLLICLLFVFLSLSMDVGLYVRDAK